MLTVSARTPFETPVLTVGFSSLPLDSGTTISSAVVEAISSTQFGAVVDSDPSATLMGSCVVNSAPVTITTALGSCTIPTGQAVLQQVQNGIIGAVYLYRFKVTLSDGRKFEQDVSQSVVAYVPLPGPAP